LLHVLWTCRDDLGIEVYAAHLNHLLRGADADQDARFVSDLAALWGVPCVVQVRDVRATANELRIGVEEAARRERYAFLSQVARQVGATRIAVGHNADDQSETVLMHWLRGAGLAGLRGMLPSTPMGDLQVIEPAEPAGGLWLIRPLLEVERTDIVAYCRQHSLTPRFDRSNLDTTYYRNRLRHDLLPYLEREYKPRFKEILRRSAKVVAADYDLLCGLRDRAWDQVVLSASNTAVTFDRRVWGELHLSLQRATVRRAVRCLRSSLRDTSFQHVDAAVQVARRGAVGAQATLPRGLLLTVGYSTLITAGAGYVPDPDFPSLGRGIPTRVRLAVPGVTVLPEGARVSVSVLPKEDLPSDWRRNENPWLAYLDAGSLGKEAYLRRRRAGDRFHPLGMGGSTKLLSELLVNEKVPAWWRDEIPLLVRADDELLWVCGWRLDERAKVRDDTSQVAVIRLDADAQGIQ
jgi:tRNA(Ile)-lysidine synthase